MMKAPTSKRSWVIAAVVASAALVSACSQGRGSDGDDDDVRPKAAAASAPRASADSASSVLSVSPAEAKQAGLRIETVQLSIVNAPLVLTGGVSANQDRIAKIIPRLPGRITAVVAVLGADVKAGQVLALVESFELGEARTAHAQARSEAGVADAALARAEKLAAEDIVPRKDYLRAKADAERAQAALRAAADKLHMLGVPTNAPDARADAVYPLTAPLAGTVLEKQAVVGTLADKDPLFTVADLSAVWVVADVFERDLSRMTKGAVAEVNVTAYPGESFQGRLIYLSDTVDAATHTVKAHIEVPNPKRRLKPGMFASATLATTAAQQAIALPASAVTLIDGKPTVFVVKGEGFEPRRIETAAEVGGKIVVKDGLSAGERVVVEGSYALKSRLLKSQISDND